MIRDRAVLFGWTAGLLIIISVIWILCQNLQAGYLLRTVNNVLINNNDSRRLSQYMQVKGGKAGLMGYWYSINSSADLMFIFTVFQDGILSPFGAIVQPDGSVKEIIPLSAHAVQVFDNLSGSTMQMYIKRIEASSIVNTEGNKR